MFKWFTNKRLNEALKRVPKFHVESRNPRVMQAINERLNFIESMLHLLKMNVSYIEQRKQQTKLQVPQHLKEVWEKRKPKYAKTISIYKLP